MKSTVSKQLTRQFYHGNMKNLILAFCFTVLLAFTSLMASWLIQQIIDTSTEASSTFSLEQLGLIGLGIALLVTIAYGIGYFSKPRFLSKAMQQYRSHAFSCLSRKNISAFSQENTSLYLSALSNDASTIENDYLGSLFPIMVQLLEFAGALALMLYYNPLLTLIAAIFSLLPLAAAILTGNRLTEAEKNVSAQNESFVGMLKDCLSGFALIKAFKAEKPVGQLFAQSVCHLASAKCKRRKLDTILAMLSNLSYFLPQFGVFLSGAYLAMNGADITAGVVLVFVQLMNYVIAPLQQIPQLMAGRRAAKALIDKLADHLEINVSDDGQNVSPVLKRGISIHNLGFSYDGQTAVFSGLNAALEAGKSYAIVGASGSGKSTLLQLMMAAYSTYTGQICYDGTDVRAISTHSLYDLVSLVQQNVFVFNSTIRENITMFHEFPDEDVAAAIRLSGLDALVASRGEEALCGENGCLLSGGEKQRIAIARSLLRKTPVLLADEATSSLDAQTAHQVSKAILALEGLTRIVVTHSLDAGLLRQYDCILTLKNGAIAEAGGFEELMAQKGYFYSLYTVSQ